VVFTDTYPTNLTNAATPAASTTYGGTVTATNSGPSVALTGAGNTIPANGSCTVTVTVTSSTLGSYLNSIAAGGVTTNAGSNPSAANATLTVGSVTIAKSFSTNPIVAGGTSV